MKQREAKLLMLEAWDAWLKKSNLNPQAATGRDALQFFYELQDKKSPLLNFFSRTRDKWQVVHEWLLDERHFGS
jgi:hypothetical protein